MRTIGTGHGSAETALTPSAIAAKRSLMIDDQADRFLFMDAFARYRGLAVKLWAAPTGPLEINALGRVARVLGPVQEAAMIEALASLRAEGIRL